MNKCAVVIGIDKSGDLPVLSAAANGAILFGKWAKSQAFNVRLLTDKGNKKVMLSDIERAIKNFVGKRTYDQMIVYFSGHGILRAQNYELWLLSGAPTDPNEAVNVTLSIELARNVGIPHLIIISDACRSNPNDFSLSQISGGIIFPIEPPKKPRPEVDIFYASLPGDPALEIPVNDASLKYDGAFTATMLRGLSGQVQRVIEVRQPPAAPQKVVPSLTLKPFLEDEVPLAVSKINIRLKQDPDVRVESRSPKYLADLTRPPFYESAGASPLPSPLPAGESSPLARPLPELSFIHDLERGRDNMRTFQDALESNEVSDIQLDRLKENVNVSPSIEQILEARGREGFETRTGFTIVGARVERAMIRSTPLDIFHEGGSDHIRIHEQNDPSQGRSILIEMSSGTGNLLAVLPGCIGTIVMEGDKVLNVNYTSSRGTDRYFEYEKVSKDLERRRALVAVAAKNGVLRLDPKKASSRGDYLPLLKSVDPTLGLYAAYAYFQVGNFEEVESVHKYMAMEPQPILFDVALLAGHLDGYHRIAPFCPLLTQGWALLGPFGKRPEDLISEISRYLVPGLWATFRREGVDIISSAMKERSFNEDIPILRMMEEKGFDYLRRGSSLGKFDTGSE